MAQTYTTENLLVHLQKLYPHHKIEMVQSLISDTINVMVDGHTVFKISGVAFTTANNLFLFLDECIKRINKYLDEPQLIIGT